MSDPTASSDSGEGTGAGAGDVARAKGDLRAAMRDLRRSITDPAGRSASIVAHLVAAPVVADARVVMAYVARAGEPDLGRFIEWCGERQTIVVLPVWDPADPMAVPTVDPDLVPEVVLVPALALTAAGARLGRGLGWYDRYLATVDAVSVGVGWDGQVVDRLPVEPHDQPLDAIVTESGWRWTTRRDHSSL